MWAQLRSFLTRFSRKVNYKFLIPSLLSRSAGDQRSPLPPPPRPTSATQNSFWATLFSRTFASHVAKMYFSQFKIDAIMFFARPVFSKSANQVSNLFAPTFLTNWNDKWHQIMGHGDSKVVSILALYYDDLSLNPGGNWQLISNLSVLINNKKKACISCLKTSFK